MSMLESSASINDDDYPFDDHVTNDQGHSFMIEASQCSLSDEASTTVYSFGYPLTRVMT